MALGVLLAWKTSDEQLLGRSVALENKIASIGNNPECSVRVEAPAPFVAKLQADDNAWWLSSTSENVFLCGIPVGTNPVRILDGELLSLGDVTYKLFSGSSSELRSKQLAQRRNYADPLTGCYHRSYLFPSLDREVRAAKRHGTSVSVAMLDLDYFKQLNDNYGMPSGDRTLVRFAALLETHLPQDAFATRFGGEEFIVVYPDTTIEKAVATLEAFQRKLDSEELLSFDGIPLRVNFSAGVSATTTLSSTDPVMELLTRADQRVMEAKQQGRNRVLWRS